MQLCFSLNNAYYFFGHNSNTAIGQVRYRLTLHLLTLLLAGQEEETGFVTGLGDYIRNNAPYALDMGAAKYDDYYRAPWATSRDLEERHKRICSEIGSSLKGFYLQFISSDKVNLVVFIDAKSANVLI